MTAARTCSTIPCFSLASLRKSQLEVWRLAARHKAFMIVASSKSSAGKLHHVGSEISACLNPVQHKLQPCLSSSSGEGVAENLRKACRVAGLVDHDSISSRGCKSCKELRTD